MNRSMSPCKGQICNGLCHSLYSTCAAPTSPLADLSSRSFPSDMPSALQFVSDAPSNTNGIPCQSFIPAQLFALAWGLVDWSFDQYCLSTLRPYLLGTKPTKGLFSAVYTPSTMSAMTASPMLSRSSGSTSRTRGWPLMSRAGSYLTLVISSFSSLSTVAV